jgi:hypothetical protein
MRKLFAESHAEHRWGKNIHHRSAQGAQPNHLANKNPLEAIQKPPNMLPISLLQITLSKDLKY